MIKGTGCDIVKVSRFEKWVSSSMIGRFFNEKELLNGNACVARQCEYYACRFAAKEAFSKALGTGLTGFSLRDVYIKKNAELIVENKALERVKEIFGEGCIFHVSLSHEKEYAVAYVIIEA